MSTTAETVAPSHVAHGGSRLGPLAVAALGVVFGDIGTSPLYTLQTCFQSANAAPNLENALGIASMLIWVLLIVVCLKYVTVLMRIDHDGEGGILALLALAEPPRIFGAPSRVGWLVWVVVIGGAMIIGDGMITPAISVISAVEGLNVATPHAQPLVVPLSAGILIALFAIQYRGTATVGSFFGPVMVLWFVAIGISGAIAIAAHPVILSALNPLYGLWFMTHHGIYGFLIFGAIILGMTGAEALYADMSHFGRMPITVAWYVFVLPALVLNYVGQAATIATNPKALDNPFYALSPGWMLWPMVALATAATIIASQALISGAFTLSEQAIALNLSPRLRVLHTSRHHKGQVYLPLINLALAIVCVTLVITFQSSARLAAMFGLAVSMTMLATDIVFYIVATRVLKWPRYAVIPLVALFGALDATFVAAGLPKFLDGAWVPLAIAAVFTTVGVTWLTGRRALAHALAAEQEPLRQFLAEYPPLEKPPRGTVVILTGDPTGVPFVNNHRWLAELVTDEIIVLMTVSPVPRPYVEEEDRVQFDFASNRFVRIKASFGYMERPRITPILNACQAATLDLDNDNTSFIYAGPAIVAKPSGGLPYLQRRLFEVLMRLSRTLAEDLEVKASRRVELGVEVAV